MLLFTCRDKELDWILSDLSKAGLTDMIEIKHDICDNGNLVTEFSSVYLDVPFNSVEDALEKAMTGDTIASEFMDKMAIYITNHEESLRTYQKELLDAGYNIPKQYLKEVYIGMSIEEIEKLCNPRNMGFLLTNFKKTEIMEIKEQLRLSGLIKYARFEDNAYDNQLNILESYSAVYIVDVPYLKQYEVRDAANQGDAFAIELFKKLGIFYNSRLQLRDALYKELIKNGFNIPIERKYDVYLGISKEELLALCK